MTTEDFIDWRGYQRGPMLLDHVQGYPASRCLVLMDNATVHGDRRFVSRLAARGCQVRRLPPYCWFLSPLDNDAFGWLVKFLRRNAKLVRDSGIETACEAGMQAFPAGNARECFYKSGYRRV